MRDDDRSDEELFAAWRNGDRAAGDLLCRRLQRRLLRYFASKVTPDVAAELVQKTWSVVMTKVHETQESTAKGLPPPKPVPSARAHIFACAHYTLQGYFRDRKRGQAREVDFEVDSVESFEPSLSRKLSMARNAELVELALRGLPLQQQAVWELRVIEELSFFEIAAVLKIPEGTVGSRLSRARALLKERLEALKKARQEETKKTSQDRFPPCL